jgi:hypothetical protein
MVGLNLERDSHIYRWDDAPVPSVTQVLSAAGLGPDYSGIAPRILQRAGWRGTEVHQILAYYTREVELPDPDPYVAPGLEGYVRAGLDYLRENRSRMTVRYVELSLYSEIHGYAGTADFCGPMCFMSGDPWTLHDWKTTATMDERAVRYQMAAYTVLFKEALDIDVTRRRAVQLLSDGRFRVYDFDQKDKRLLKQDQATFLWALDKALQRPPDSWLTPVVEQD